MQALCEEWQKTRKKGIFCVLGDRPWPVSTVRGQANGGTAAFEATLQYVLRVYSKKFKG